MLHVVFALHRPKVGLDTVPSVLRASWERTLFINALPIRTANAWGIFDLVAIYFYHKVVLIVLAWLETAHAEEPGKTQ